VTTLPSSFFPPAKASFSLYLAQGRFARKVFDYNAWTPPPSLSLPPSFAILELPLFFFLFPLLPARQLRNPRQRNSRSASIPFSSPLPSRCPPSPFPFPLSPSGKACFGFCGSDECRTKECPPSLPPLFPSPHGSFLFLFLPPTEAIDNSRTHRIERPFPFPHSGSPLFFP